MHKQMNMFGEPVECSTSRQKRAKSQLAKKREACRQPFLFSQRDMAQVTQTTQCGTVRDDVSIAPLVLEMQGTDEDKNRYAIEQERKHTIGAF